MIIKTKIPACGDINTYVNKPVTDRRSKSANTIGKIIAAEAKGSECEITMEIYKDMSVEMNGTKLMSMTIE